MKIIQRDAEKNLLKAAQFFPVVTVLGPRQSGKTTLVRKCFPDYEYVNLEDPEIHELAVTDENAFFRRFASPVIIDEIQRAPQLLNKIQVLADEALRGLPEVQSGERAETVSWPLMARFILTGSFQQALKASVSQSLAGRTAIINLLPLSVGELEAAGITRSRDQYLYNGFMPGLYSHNQPANMLYSAYFQTYIEKDVQTILNVKNKGAFDKFIRLLAGRTGQVLSLESLSNDTGVSVSTVSNWISVLEASYIIFRVEPYYENFTKRLIKAPKIYFTDTGLLCWLLRIKDPEQVARDPLVGSIFENLVMLELLKKQYNFGMDKDIYYFRDSKGFEIDAIIPQAHGGFVPVEIKSAMTFSRDFITGLAKMRHITPKAVNPALIYSGELEFDIDGISCVNFRHAGNCIQS